MNEIKVGKVVFLTNDCNQGRAMLSILIDKLKDVEICIAHIELPNMSFSQRIVATYREKGLSKTWQLIKKKFFSLRYWGVKTGLFEFSPEPVYPPIKQNSGDYDLTYQKFNSYKSEELRSWLIRQDPDLMLLGGAAPLKKKIFSVPKHGTINIHPGDIPSYRGLDCIFWSLWDGNALKMTSHFIDEHIDRGIIVSKMEVDCGGKALKDIVKECDRIAGVLVVESINKLRAGCKLERVEGEGRYCPAMPTFKMIKLIRQFDSKV